MPASSLVLTVHSGQTWGRGAAWGPAEAGGSPGHRGWGPLSVLRAGLAASQEPGPAQSATEGLEILPVGVVGTQTSL